MATEGNTGAVKKLLKHFNILYQLNSRNCKISTNSSTRNCQIQFSFLICLCFHSALLTAVEWLKPQNQISSKISRFYRVGMEALKIFLNIYPRRYLEHVITSNLPSWVTWMLRPEHSKYTHFRIIYTKCYLCVIKEISWKLESIPRKFKEVFFWLLFGGFLGGFRNKEILNLDCWSTAGHAKIVHLKIKLIS